MNHFNEPARFRRWFNIQRETLLVEHLDGRIDIVSMPEKTGYGPFNLGAYSPELFKEAACAGAERISNEPARDRMAVWFRLSSGESNPIEMGYRDFPPAPHFTARDWLDLPSREFPY